MQALSFQSFFNMRNIAAINQFITAFHLKHPDGMISFPAKINFNTNGHCRERYSEVHIVISANLNTIYLLNKNLESEEFRDIFKDPRDIFHFVKNKCLIIKSKESDNYVEIYPII